MIKGYTMKYIVFVFAFLVSLHPLSKLTYLDRNVVLINGKQKFYKSIKQVDFKFSAKTFILTPKIRFDNSTKIETVKKMFEYEDATSGTDMDIYTTIFIRASKEKGGGCWMLVFDAKTSKLLQMVYSESSGGLFFYTS